MKVKDESSILGRGSQTSIGAKYRNTCVLMFKCSLRESKVVKGGLESPTIVCLVVLLLRHGKPHSFAITFLELDLVLHYIFLSLDIDL